MGLPVGGRPSNEWCRLAIGTKGRNGQSLATVCVSVSYDRPICLPSYTLCEVLTRYHTAFDWRIYSHVSTCYLRHALLMQETWHGMNDESCARI
jgi:hypothetical protein